MTDCTDPTSPPTSLTAAVTAVRRRAFTALLNGEQPRLADLAEAASRDTISAAQAIAWLETAGALERDGDRLAGAHGLTMRDTPHTLTINGRTLHTWCAFDAVAIPVALRATGRAASTCPTCRAALVVDLVDGTPTGDPAARIWLPTGPCTNVLADFCAHANLFCTPEHLDAWRNTSGQPPGRVVTLAEIAALAFDAWSDVATPPHR